MRSVALARTGTRARLRGVRTRHRRASQLLEFAIVLPFFMLMLVLVVDMGRLVLVRSALHDAAYTSARAAAQVGGTDLNGQRISQQIFYDEVQASPLLDTTKVRTFTAGPARCSTATRMVTVRSTYQFDFLTPGLYSLISAGAGQTAAGGWTVDTVGVGRCEVIR
jgi:Flp pilus assembly protein TadG